MKRTISTDDRATARAAGAVLCHAPDGDIRARMARASADDAMGHGTTAAEALDNLATDLLGRSRYIDRVLGDDPARALSAALGYLGTACDSIGRDGGNGILARELQTEIATVRRMIEAVIAKHNSR